MRQRKRVSCFRTHRSRQVQISVLSALEALLQILNDILDVEDCPGEDRNDVPDR